MVQEVPLEHSSQSVTSPRVAEEDIFTSLEMVREILECQHFARLHFAKHGHSDGIVPYDIVIVDHARKELDRVIKRLRYQAGTIAAVGTGLNERPQYIDVRDGLKSAAQILRHRLERALVVEWLPSDLPKIFVHSDEFREICYNLFLHSVLALEGRCGRITIEAITQPPTARWPGGVRVRFVDSGPTVLERHLHMLFNPSFFTEAPRRVDGLLLYVTKRLTTKNHGRITAYNCYGCATAVCVDFPSRPFSV